MSQEKKTQLEIKVYTYIDEDGEEQIDYDKTYDEAKNSIEKLKELYNFNKN